MKVSTLALAALVACGTSGFEALDDANGTVAPVTPVVITLTRGTTWKVPSDWNGASNAILCVGLGGPGAVVGPAADGASGADDGGGGGGGNGGVPGVGDGGTQLGGDGGMSATGMGGATGFTAPGQAGSRVGGGAGGGVIESAFG